MQEIDWQQVGVVIAAIVDFLGDFTTVLLGLASLVAYLRLRKQIVAAILLLRLNHVNDRVNDLGKTLDLILTAEITKGKSSALRALFGRLNGQMLPLCDVVPELSDLQKQVDAIAHASGALNERRIQLVDATH
jgi:hypothetical protein